jgi:adenylate cyclase
VKASAEIERKYLLSTLPPRALLGDGVAITQGYIDSGDPEIRVRRLGARHFLAIKSGEGLRRLEVEVEISADTHGRLWALTEGARVVKTRYRLNDGGHSWEIDEYAEALSGLYTAEVELTSITDAVTPPAVLSIVREVTDDPRYWNKHLARRGRPWADASSSDQTPPP